jgi:RHS repeat-associated protein
MPTLNRAFGRLTANLGLFFLLAVVGISQTSPIRVTVWGRGQGTTMTAAGYFIDPDDGSDLWVTQSAVTSMQGTTLSLGTRVALIGRTHELAISNAGAGNLSIAPEPGYYVEINGMRRNKVEFSGDSNHTIRVLPEGATQSGRAGTASSLEPGSISWRVALGSTLNGSGAGNITLVDLGVDTDWSSLFTPSALDYEASSNEIRVHRDGGVLRQIVANQAAVDIVSVTATSYEIRFYHPMQKTGASFPYSFTGRPFETYRIEQGDSSTSLKFTRETRDITNYTQDSVPVSSRYIMKASRSGTAPDFAWQVDDWTRENETVLTQKLAQFYGTSQGRDKEFTIKSPGGTAVSNLSRVCIDLGWGEETGSQDPGGYSSLRSSYAYYAQESDPSYTYLRSVAVPGGGWEAYEYYSATPTDIRLAGMIKRKFRPYLNYPATISLDPTLGEVTYFEYATDPFGFYRRTSLVETKINNVTVARSATSYANSTANGMQVVTATRVDSTNSTESLTSTSKFYREDVPDAFFRHQIHSSTDSAGVMGVFAYQRGTWNGTAFTFSASNGLATGTASKTSAISGTNSSSGNTLYATHDGYDIDDIYLIPGKSTLKTVIRDSRALIVKDTTHIWSDGNWHLIDSNNFSYDSAGRLIMASTQNGTVHTNDYEGASKVSETTPAGVTFNYTYDAANRLKKVVKEAAGTAITAIQTEYTYDAADRLLEEKISAANPPAGAEKITASTSYDLAGRVTSSTSAGLSGGTYTFDPANRRTTHTNALSGTVIQESYRDGRPLSIQGTAAVHKFFSYAVDALGIQSVTERIGTSTSSRWVKSYRDWIGRALKTEAPGVLGIGLMTSQNFYDSTKGYLIKSQGVGYAPTRYVYDTNGALIRSGLDIGDDDLILASSDRITDVASKVELVDGAWWATQEVRTYPTKDSATSMRASLTRTRLTGHAANQIAETKTTDILDNTTVSTVTLDTTAKTVTTTVSRSGTTAVATTIQTNGLTTSATGVDDLTTNYVYDHLHRPSSQTDSRLKSTRTQYVTGSSRPQKVFNSLAVDATPITQFTYDDLGRVVATGDANNQYAYTHYNARGQAYRVWGSRTIPLEYGYDDATGAQTTLKTFREGSGWEGNVWPSVTGTADTTTWVYDAHTGVLLEKQDALHTASAPRKTTSAYNAYGQTRTITSARGIVETLAYDSQTGELRSQSSSDTNTPTVSYTYTRSGFLKTVEDATGTRTFTHCDCGRVTEEALGTFYGGRKLNWDLSTTVGYKGQLKGVKLSNGTSIEMDLAYGYSTSTERLETITGVQNSATRVFRYGYLSDAPVLSSLSVDGSSFAVTRGYADNDYLLTSIDSKWGADSITRFDYTHSPLRQRETSKQSGAAFADYGEPTYQSFSYSTRGELTSAIGFMGSATTDYSRPLPGRRFAYAYDNAGNRKSSDRTGVGDLAEIYQTNALNQYTKKENNSLNVSGTTAVDTKVVVSPLPGTGQRPAQASQQGRFWNQELIVPNESSAWRGEVTVLAVKSGNNTIQSAVRLAHLPLAEQSFIYDLDGNMTDDGLWTYGYDGQNRLIRMATTSGAALLGYPNRVLTFQYDYMGRRVQKRVVNADTSAEILSRRFVYEGWNLLAEYNAAGGTTMGSIVRSYTWGLDLIGSMGQTGGVGALLQITDHSSGKSYLPTYDGNGNLVSIVNASTGALAAAYEYNSFGETLRVEVYDNDMSDQPFRSSTKYTDLETHLIYYGRRYYHFGLGRFISRDPKEEFGGVNLYGFVHNDPVNSWDYLGMNAQTYTGETIEAFSNRLWPQPDRDDFSDDEYGGGYDDGGMDDASGIGTYRVYMDGVFVGNVDFGSNLYQFASYVSGRAGGDVAMATQRSSSITLGPITDADDPSIVYASSQTSSQPPIPMIDIASELSQLRTDFSGIPGGGPLLAGGPVPGAAPKSTPQKWSKAACADLASDINKRQSTYNYDANVLRDTLEMQQGANWTLYWIDRAKDTALSLAGGQVAKGIGAARTAIFAPQATPIVRGMVQANLVNVYQSNFGKAVSYASGPLIDEAVTEGIGQLSELPLSSGTDGLRSEIQNTVNAMERRTKQQADMLSALRKTYTKECR